MIGASSASIRRMKPMKIAGMIASVVLLASGLTSCGGSGGDDKASGARGSDKSGDADACRAWNKLPDDASDADTEKAIESAESGALKDAFSELMAYPDDLELDDLDKVAGTYEQIRDACADADVKLPSFAELMGGGEASEDLPACPETAGQKVTYDDIVKMNSDGCIDSTGGQTVVVYGGKCTDGRQFAYKNLTDIKPDPDGKDDRAYVVAGPGESGTVIVDKDEESDAMLKLEMDCSS